jgi:CHAT domain-containing protein
MTIYSLGQQPVSDPKARKRVWWCPTGALSSLPIHAAGIYEGQMQDHVSKYVISSYTPTITALNRLLEETPAHSFASGTSKILLVAQPTSIGHTPLLNVHEEMDRVKSFVPLENTEYLNAGQGVSVSDALKSLKTAKVVHLACHGHQDQENPLNSGFELEDGRLTLEQLMQVDTPQAQLAYLSACDSAGMDESRPDEGLNLVGTMIFVGFRSVIGTMW